MPVNKTIIEGSVYVGEPSALGDPCLVVTFGPQDVALRWFNVDPVSLQKLLSDMSHQLITAEAELKRRQREADNQ